MERRTKRLWFSVILTVILLTLCFIGFILSPSMTLGAQSGILAVCFYPQAKRFFDWLCKEDEVEE